MKALKKVLAVTACAAIAFSAMPKAEAEAAGVLASYSFDDTNGMTDPGFGTLPSIVNDSERGNVLQFADGESSTYKTEEGQAKGAHKCEIVGGSPSTYEIPNPYAGKSYTSMTYAFWVKATDASASENGAGILGWVTGTMTDDHPDARAGEKTQADVGWYEEGVYIFGTNIALSNPVGIEKAMLNFAGLYHNWYCLWNEGIDLADGQWHYVMVTTDSSQANTQVYIDGAAVVSDNGYSDLGKRFNHGEKDASNKANTLEPTLMELVTRADTKLYLGQTGSSPTSSSVYIDDLVFYDSMVTDAEAVSFYNAAKTGASNAGGTGTQSGTDAGSASDGSASQTGSNTSVSNNKKTNGSTTSNLPQTGVMSTATLVGIGVAVIGAGTMLLKKKEDK